ncbi:arginase family enzyme [Streptacidiphilus sp. MAP12-20]|uniref:arginase family protein n=1 Tax=Streptacidiphilus sp. MAP12-20 TaxID=3156299 RepID=UPI00351891FE
MEDTALSVDIDVLDPHIMRSVTNPLPDGLGPGELQAVIEAAAAHGRRVRQFMLTEFAPAESAGVADAATAAHLLMRSIDACLR